MTNWHDGKPILSRLPDKGFQDNLAVIALTSWIDEKLTDKAEQLQNFYKELNPATAKDESLDFLAWLVGLSGSFYDNNWSPQVKRRLIAAAHPILWSKRGTLEAISFVLSAHEIKHHIWTDGDLTISFRLGQKPFGTNKLRFYVRLPVTYNRKGLEFREAERTLRSFAPAIVEHKVVHDYFRLGFSQLGDPLFRSNTFKTT